MGKRRRHVDDPLFYFDWIGNVISLPGGETASDLKQILLQKMVQKLGYKTGSENEGSENQGEGT
eukprot:1077418-Prorocentrum_lima.AAC.1